MTDDIGVVQLEWNTSCFGSIIRYYWVGNFSWQVRPKFVSNIIFSELSGTPTWGIIEVKSSEAWVIAAWFLKDWLNRFWTSVHSVRLSACVCVCYDRTYPAFKQQAPARRVPYSLLIPLNQLSPTKQANSWRNTQTHRQHTDEWTQTHNKEATCHKNCTKHRKILPASSAFQWNYTLDFSCGRHPLFKNKFFF